MSQEQPFLQQVRNTANITLDVIIAGLISNTSNASACTNAVQVTAQSAYGQANIALAVAEAAYTQANSAESTALSGVGSAATALAVAEAAYNQANAAYANSNTAFAASGVTQGTYGTSYAIPTVSVDYRGRVTSISTTTPGQFSSTLAGVVPASGGGTSNFLRADGTWNQPTTVLVAGSTSNYTRTGTSGLTSSDPDLQITLAANHVYQVTARLYINANEGYYMGMYFSGTVNNGYYHFMQNDGGYVYGKAINSQITTTGGTTMIELNGTIYTGSSGVISAAWGNNGGFNATRYSGSTITAILCA